MELSVTGYQSLTIDGRSLSKPFRAFAAAVQVQPLDAPEYIASGSTRKLDLHSGAVFTAPTLCHRLGALS